MTTSTSSSTSRRPALAFAAFGLIAGCGQASPSDAPDRPAAAPQARPAAPRARADPAALYTADLAAAVAGAKKRPAPPSASFGGMACTPAAIAGASPASRTLTLTLPEDAAARDHVLAVVTPERGLLEIYSPLPDPTDEADVILPSRTISWLKARTQRRFATTTDRLDGLRAGADTPEALFIEAGRYRFALVNGIDAALLKANGKKVEVKAACAFDWTP